MQLLQAFDATKYDPSQGVGGFPIGRHPVEVESSEVKATNDNSGGYLQLNLRITDGPHTGTVGAYRLNLYNQSQKAVEIAHRQLSAISHVTGIFQINDSSQLHGARFVINVVPQKNDPQYTEVNKVFDMNGNEPARAGSGSQQQQPQGQQQNNQGNQQQSQGQGQGQGGWGNQQQNNNQQPQQQPQNNGNGGNGGGWGNGGNNQQPQSNQQQNNSGAAWGNGGNQQQPQGQQQNNQGNNGGGWSQNNSGGNGGNNGGNGTAAPWGNRN